MNINPNARFELRCFDTENADHSESCECRTLYVLVSNWIQCAWCKYWQPIAGLAVVPYIDTRENQNEEKK